MLCIQRNTKSILVVQIHVLLFLDNMMGECPQRMKCLCTVIYLNRDSEPVEFKARSLYLSCIAFGAFLVDPKY